MYSTGPDLGRLGGAGVGLCIASTALTMFFAMAVSPKNIGVLKNSTSPGTRTGLVFERNSVTPQKALGSPPMTQNKLDDFDPKRWIPRNQIVSISTNHAPKATSSVLGSVGEGDCMASLWPGRNFEGKATQALSRTRSATCCMPQRFCSMSRRESEAEANIDALRTRTSSEMSLRKPRISVLYVQIVTS